jgi:hypothetical protein
MKLANIILEIDYKSYEAMVQVTFGEEGAEGYDDALRALPGVTTVTKASSNAEVGKVNYKVKLITQKTPQEAFEAFKNNATAKYTNVVSVEVGENTIEEK